jgi:hypothetical protein
MAIIKNHDVDTSGLPPEGIHLLLITKAITNFSRQRNEEMLEMTTELVPSKERLKIYLMLEGKGTFAIGPFCNATGLIRPKDPEASFELSPKIVRGRYLYGEIVHQTKDDVTRAQVKKFFTFEQACKELKDSSRLTQVDQEPLVLPIIVTQPASNPARLAQPVQQPAQRPLVKAAAAGADTDPDDIPF